MTILFPNDALNPLRVERDFEPQSQAARQADLDVLLLDFDALAQNEISRSVRFIRPTDDLQVLVYRGWMLRSEQYAALYNALLERNWRLLNDANSYDLCHELPNWYPLLEGRTPRSKWLPIPDCFDAARVLEAAASFYCAPLIVKDYVKSRKHEWADSCFIADASDAREVERVTQNFLSRQAENLAGGLVLRQFVQLRSVQSEASSGAPIVNEWRLFWLDHMLICCAPNAMAPAEEPSPQVLVRYQNLAARIASRFFSMDIAQKAEGDWIVIELGDGGVSGLPEQMDARALHTGLERLEI